MNSLRPADLEMRLAVLDHFVETGEARPVAVLASALGRPRTEVADTLDRLAAGRALVLHPGTHDVLMMPPFSAVPTPFRVESGGRGWWANCIWDALGVPVVLGTDARIRTTCGDCGMPLELSVRNDALEEARGIIHFAVPAARWWEDIVYT